MTTTTYPVTGMTCGRCVQAVTVKLGNLTEVERMPVGLVTDGVSSVTVTSDAPLSLSAVGQALDEAGGYLLTAS